MDSPLLNGVHEEFVKRVDENFNRTDSRLKLLEAKMDSYTDLAINIEKLAISTDRLTKEFENQRERLNELESRDGERWRQATGYAVTVVIGLLIGWFMSQFGIV